MAEIKSLSVRHNEIIDYLMANPRVQLKMVADHFGISQPWLSQVIHSEIFQDSLREKQDIAFHHTILPLREKMQNIAHQALDKIVEELDKPQDIRDVKEVASDVLDRLGFGTKQQAGTIINNTQVNQTVHLRTELEEARALLGKAQATRPQALEVMVDGERSAIKLPATNSTGVGSVIEGAVVRQPPGLAPIDTKAKTGTEA